MPRKTDAEYQRLQKEKEAFLEALYKSAGLVTFACDETNYPYEEYKRELANNPSFKMQVDEINHRLLDVAEAQLFKLVQEGYDKAIFYYLNNKGQDRGYGIKVDLNHTHQFEQPLLMPLEGDNKSVDESKILPGQYSGSMPPKNDPQGK